MVPFVGKDTPIRVNARKKSVVNSVCVHKLRIKDNRFSSIVFTFYIMLRLKLNIPIVVFCVKII